MQILQLTKKKFSQTNPLRFKQPKKYIDHQGKITENLQDIVESLKIKFPEFTKQELENCFHQNNRDIYSTLNFLKQYVKKEQKFKEQKKKEIQKEDQNLILHTEKNIGQCQQLNDVAIVLYDLSQKIKQQIDQKNIEKTKQQLAENNLLAIACKIQRKNLAQLKNNLPQKQEELIQKQKIQKILNDEQLRLFRELESKKRNKLEINRNIF